ncbi:MAG TPA: AraC family transcriptional regulator [Vicinamibacterales bacterium]|nr:AraC family transcriptional regulator [Vicinamibacterales bacterium]
MMLTLDVAARASTIVVLVVIGVVLLRGLRGSAFAWIGCFFFSTVAAYLVVTSSHYSPIPGVHVLLRALAYASPAAFWIFNAAFFDEDAALSRNNLALAVVFVALGFAQHAVGELHIAYYAATVAIAILALARVFRGTPADLVEPRRRLRAAFSIIVGIEMIIVIGADLFLQAAAQTPLLQLIKSTGALWLTSLFGAWLLAPRAELIPAGTPEPAPHPAPQPVSEDDRFRARLLNLMETDRAYRREGLTIGALAAALDIPEYRVRRIINQQLGYRNFNTFVGHFRIDEACRILADPSQERLPILNLALDLGYGSLGPFNRAFRARVGQTPTEYRRAKLAIAAPAMAEDRNRQPNLKIAKKS